MRVAGRRVSTGSTRFGGAARFVVAILLAAASVLVAATPAQADSIRDREYWLDDYGISDAWAVTEGKGVTIAVIDTGIDGTHPDLDGAVVGGADFSTLGSSDGQTPVGDGDSSHGTMVASLAAGRGRGTSGVIGAAPEASLLAISIGFSESDGPNSDDQIADAVRWAVDNGADVINMSLTRNTLDWPTSWDDAFLYAMQNDVVIVAAAGNRGSGTTQVGAPATMPGVLTVGGVDRSGRASWDASSQGITIGVSAPSEQLVGATPGAGYVLWDGTSGATPIVAGIVALVRAAHPELSAANVIERIISTATPAGVAGADPIYGYGLVDAAAAVSSDVDEVTANPMGDLSEWIRINRRAAAETPTPETLAPTPGATVAPEPEKTDASPLGTLLPTVTELRDVGIPLLLFTVFGSAAILVIAAAARQFRASRRKE
ncbi:type VII secretion-associated serine protease mycosin [Conyzicola lurida]|uniref:Type VII secretion-associated serine protease mycosin n=1 Tax=Conyzicola lurida TaxID=1172621 RepID=A0A841AEV5_9MICO|nr:type VII secretion-associated serine protease mycosin [Conyzicola lurida]